MHVMFLYASTGSGHLKAAEYVREALFRKNRNIRVSMADVLNLCNFPIESFVLKAFRFLVSRCPNTYRFLYRITENTAFFNYVAGWFFSRSIVVLKEKCLSTDIQSIVCTHPFALLFASRLKKELGDKSPLVMGIVTDYQIHRFWLYSQIDLYFVPNEEMRKKLLNLGWCADKVKVTGIPCPIDIKNAINTHEILKPFWLIAGGGWGLGNLENTARSLLKKYKNCNIMVITGENRLLFSRLRVLQKQNPDRLIVKGTIPHLYDEMKNALAVLTKPGGLTVTEAMILKKPLILLKPLPGAEEKNLKYLVDQGAAVSYRSFQRKPEVIGCWQQLYSKQQIRTAQTDSSQRIAGWIMQVMGAVDY